MSGGGPKLCSHASPLPASVAKFVEEPDAVHKHAAGISLNFMDYLREIPKPSPQWPPPSMIVY